MGFKIVGYRRVERPTRYMVIDRKGVVVLHPTDYVNSYNARKYLSKYFHELRLEAKHRGCRYVLIVKDLDDEHYQVYYVYQVD